MKVFWNPVQFAHAPDFFLARGTVRPNYEIPVRAESLLAACADMGLSVVAPPPVDIATLLAVHEPEYLAFLRDGYAAWAEIPDTGPEIVANHHPSPEMMANGARAPSNIVGQAGWFAADAACPIGPHTWEAAFHAAAGAAAAADEVARGSNAYALARPPGHHAYRARAGGHCYLNNAAIAAERLRAKGAERVAILDIDSHHGNGTQGIFWNRPDVPWFTGHATERGGGDGAGCNVNLPLAIGTGDDGWLRAVSDGIDAIRAYGAEALVVSLGFDASVDEPLNALSVTADGFSRAGAAIGALGLPTAIVQEGGYNVDVIGGLLTRFLGGFGG